MSSMYMQLVDVNDLKGLPETIEEILEGQASCVKFNPYGTLVATGCVNGDVVIWDYQTRGPTRRFQGHTASVTGLLWSLSGRHITSVSLDGHAVVWDVITGAKLLDKDLEHGPITSASQSLAESAHVNAGQGRMLVCFQSVPPQLLSLAPPSSSEQQNRASIRELWLDGEGKTVKLSSIRPNETLQTNNSNKATSIMAEISPSNEYILAASPGLLWLTKTDTMQVIDIVRIAGNPEIHTIHFAPTNNTSSTTPTTRVVVTAADKVVRIFEINTANGSSNINDNSSANPSMVLQTLLETPGHQLPKQGSIMYALLPLLSTGTNGGVSTGALLDEQTVNERCVLTLVRRFEAPMERDNWRCACFSPDGEHVVSAIDSEEEHIIYTWNAHFGYSENTLQGGGTDGIIAMQWHPSVRPLQLLALGRSGVVYIWTKIFTQQWGAFAPDFEDLIENRQHIESETEFDASAAVNNRDSSNGEEEDDAMHVSKMATSDEDGEDVDIVTLSKDDQLENDAATLKKYGNTTETPLYHVPVQLLPDCAGIYNFRGGGEEQQMNDEVEEKECVVEALPPEKSVSINEEDEEGLQPSNRVGGYQNNIQQRGQHQSMMMNNRSAALERHNPDLETLEQVESRLTRGSIKHSVFNLLKQADERGMTLQDLATTIMQKGLKHWDDIKTARNSIASTIGYDPAFVRVGPGTFALSLYVDPEMLVVRRSKPGGGGDPMETD